MSRGHFITFEGCEGCGKTTIIDAVYKKLKDMGLPVISVREPGGTKLGEGIRKVLLEAKMQIEISARSEIFLFLAARAQHVKEKIVPELKNGAIILCDRFNDSTIAYQGFARGLGFEEAKRLCDFCCEGLAPDLTIFLDVDPTVGLERTQKISKENAEADTLDRIERERVDFHYRVREGYLKLADENPNRIVTVDANMELESVKAESCAVVETFLTQRKKEHR